VVIIEIKEEIKKYLEYNERESITYQNLWDTVKAVLRGNIIATNPYIKNTGRPQLNILILHVKLLEKKNKINQK
jgi:hypothetical protein